MSVNSPLEYIGINAPISQRDIASTSTQNPDGTNIAMNDRQLLESNFEKKGDQSSAISKSTTEERKTEEESQRSEGKAQGNAFVQSAIVDKLKTVNDQLSFKSTSLVFEFDDANDPPIVKVVDKESGDVIREIPPQELREIAKALTEIADNINRTDTKKSNTLSSGIFIDERF